MPLNAQRLFISTLLLTLFSSYANANQLPDFTRLVEQNSAAVVNISTTQKVRSQKSFLPQGAEIPENSEYGELLEHFFGLPGQRPKSRIAQSLGSGFVISEDGYLLTNHHVVKNADEIIVRFQDRRELKATLVGSDKGTDVALLKVDARGLPVVKFGSSQQLKVGEWVFAIGSPFRFDSSVTAGIVSAKGRSLPQENYVPFIQTDVAINPGNSGGPLFNLKGEVVGINSQIYSRSGGFMGLSFAIPIDVAMDVSNQIKKSGHVVRGWLGVRIQDVTRELAESFGMKKPYGALVAQVIPDSPAQKAGLKVGDVIVSFNGKTVDKSASLPPMVGSASMAKKSRVKVIRNKLHKTIYVKLESLPEDEALVEPANDVKKSGQVFGLTIIDLPASVREQLDIKTGGVYVQAVTSGAATHAGIRKGDVILQLGGDTLKGVSHFTQVAKKLKKNQFVSVLINRRGNPIFLALKK
ncbi:MAG: serine peptidase [Cycloclasticus sp. symbiont of Poecilosclerida sp. M]|nr:MAG: serine peptidase [Cycloclasticus sp. symbiont of Poecilosclerida sp. M]